jgi:hypothetical protein
VLADLQIGGVGGAFDEIAGRIRSPMIWPPNRNDTSELTSDACSALPSVSLMVRMTWPTRWAAWNIVGAFITVSRSPVSGLS